MANQFVNPNEEESRSNARNRSGGRLKNQRGMPLDMFNPNPAANRRQGRSGLRPLSQRGEGVVNPRVSPPQTATQTRSRTKTPTQTATPTNTPTFTATPTNTKTVSPSPTQGVSATGTPTQTSTANKTDSYTFVRIMDDAYGKPVYIATFSQNYTFTYPT